MLSRDQNKFCLSISFSNSLISRKVQPSRPINKTSGKQLSYDIDSLVRAKAAIFAAVNILIGSLNLEFEDIRRIYLAGGFGNYLDRKKALTIGLIPDLPLERIQFVGNTSIMGAKIAMLSEEALETCYEISRKITYYDLITHSNYMDEFISAKFLPHTDLEKFPDVSILKT